jgi:hypothetical protein
LTTSLDRLRNEATALSNGPGLYVLMSSIAIPLRPGWNLIAYPAQADQPIREALASITNSYTTVYGYDIRNQADPWAVFDTASPAWVSDLSVLQTGNGYWINATEAITLHLRSNPGASLAALNTFAEPLSGPPATFYGILEPSTSITPRPGLPVVARIGETICGRATTRQVEEAIVFVIDVAPAGAQAECGIVGRVVTITVGAYALAEQPIWNNGRPTMVSGRLR